MATNLSSLSITAFEFLSNEIDKHAGLNQVLAWAAATTQDFPNPQIVAEVITQDEYTHDVIVPYKDLFLVYDTT